MGRKKAREYAFKCVYQFDFLNIDKSRNIQDVIDNDLKKILDSCFENEEFSNDDKLFITQIVLGVYKELDNIDKLILDKLKKWEFSRIPKVDIAILRIAVFEILNLDTPHKVVVNEAVELAKVYSNDDSYSFINGVLAKIIEDIRS